MGMNRKMMRKNRRNGRRKRRRRRRRRRRRKRNKVKYRLMMVEGSLVLHHQQPRILLTQR